MDIAPQNLKQQQRPGAFQAAAGRAGTGTNHHEQKQKALGKGRPLSKIRGGKARGRHDGRNLKRRMADGLADRGIKSTQVQGDEQNAAQHNSHIQAQLLVLEYTFEIAQHQQIVAAEVHAEQRHKHRGHILNVGRITGEGVVFHAEAAGAGGAEGGADRFQQGHLPDDKENNVGYGQNQVQDVQNYRGFPHFGNQLAHVGAGAFRPQKVHGKALSLAAARGESQ